MERKEVAVTAEDQWTDWVELKMGANGTRENPFDVRVKGIGSNTIAVQMKGPGEADNEASTLGNPPVAGDEHRIGVATQHCFVRAGVPTGGYASAGTTVIVSG